ncbi:alpha/beta fold hydrolase [Rubritalea tangerina]|uniref:Alpha/beta fold hydrolase n=1 Tax=Rubritalea tangerina TaxID=430798 RepID=A0ABW4Z9H0_9BACT
MIYALHGAVGMAADWKSFALSMKQEGEAVARVDLWQFLACCPMPLAQFGNAFNREVHSKQPVLLGYSMGGRLALHALLSNPKMYKAAIIVSAHTGIEEEDKPARQAQDAAWAAKALSGDWDDFLNAWNRQGVLEGGIMPDRSALKRQREAVARSFMDWSVGTQENLLPRLKELSCPILWVVGENDQKFLAVARRAMQELSNGQLVVIPDCGHRVPWEQAEAFHAVVTKFLQSNSESRLSQ